MKPLSLKIFPFLKWMLLITLLLIALVNVGGRVLLANVESFRAELEQQLGDYGVRGVALENLSAKWQGLQPVLKIRDGSLSIPGRAQALSVSTLELHVKLLESLWRGDLILESVYSNIEKLILVRDIKGGWWLNDIPLGTQQSVASNIDIYRFFQRLPTFVDIDIGLIQIRDLRQNVDYLIQNSHLRSSRKNRQLSMQLNARLPATLGKKIRLLLTGDDTHQQLYIEAEQLDMARLVQLALVEKNDLKQARLNIRSWIELKKFRPSVVVSEAEVSALEFANDLASGQSYNFSIRQTAHLDDAGWKLSAQVHHAGKGAQAIDDFRFQLAADPKTGSPQLWLNRLDLSALKFVLADLKVSEKLTRQWKKAAVQGILKDVTLQLNRENPQNSLLNFDFEQVSLKRSGNIPGVGKISGHFLYAQGRAQLSLSSDALEVDFGDLFRAPLKLGKVSAEAIAHVGENAQLLQVTRFAAQNDDLAVDARLWLETAPGKLPFAFIRSQYRQGRVAAVKHYLPVTIMPPQVVEWLDQALLGGSIEQGDFIFHGRLKEPSKLQKNSAGLLQASFSVENPRIHFKPGWPLVHQGEGQIDFVNAGMQLQFSNSRLAASAIDHLTLAIDDFNRAGIRLKAHTRAGAAQLLETLAQLPVLKQLDEFRQKATTIAGQVDTVLELQIPLSDNYPEKFNVKSTAKLSDVTLQLPQWMIDLRQLNGKFEINDEYVSARGLSALFHGDKVKLAISPDRKNRRTRFDINGRITSRKLLQLAPDFLRLPVSGDSQWQASVSVAHRPSAQNPLLEISAQSALQGSELAFPPPLRVEKSARRELDFNAELFLHESFDFKLKMHNQLQAQGRINLQDDAKRTLQYLNVALQHSELPAGKQGITLNGHAGRLDSGQWFDYIKQYFPKPDDAAEPFLQQVRLVDLSIDRLVIGAQQAQQARIKLRNAGQALQGSIDSSLIKGDFILPYRMSEQQPLVAVLDYIKLQKSNSKQKFRAQIEDMPNLSIKSRKIAYQNMEVFDFVLKTRNQGNIFQVDQLDFLRDQVTLKSSGHWQYQPQTAEQVSVFNIAIKGRDFGQVVNNLGLGETIKGGKIDFNGQIGWGGSLFSINWATLIGEVNLKLEDGYLKNVEPGAGRFVGLLSFSALPRRLFLDFGDVVKGGMQFDTIKGRFSIKGEVMTTDNASLNSVSAKVRVSGETNLRRKTYDQTMIITPKVGDTLPVLGALTAGNAVGWGLLLLQKIFKKPIDKSVQIEYKVSGSWDNPKIELVEKKKRVIEQNENFFGSDH